MSEADEVTLDELKRHLCDCLPVIEQIMMFGERFVAEYRAFNETTDQFLPFDDPEETLTEFQKKLKKAREEEALARIKTHVLLLVSAVMEIHITAQNELPEINWLENKNVVNND